jgi:hypothetical protein
MVEAYPLQWPEGWKRTPRHLRKSGPFKVPPGQARQEMMEEIRRLGGRDIIVSSDQPLNKDGSPSMVRRSIWDSGVAVYFNRKGKLVVFACDQYAEIHDNMRAIGKTAEAMRGIERWGASDMLERAFTGFEALPAPDPWWQILGLTGPNATRADIAIAYRKASNAAHPDKPGGSHDRMAAVNAARDEGLARFEK